MKKAMFAFAAVILLASCKKSMDEMEKQTAVESEESALCGSTKCADGQAALWVRGKGCQCISTK